jgi:tRNA threonylcarbamoyladenosine biosynthesis protein TsaB
MIVLGFDTATPSTAVGLRLADGGTLQARDDPGPRQRPGHTTRLLAMAAQLLGEAGTGWGALDRIAVGLGPGRFTGLRVGIATARGLAQSLAAELVGVSSLRALAGGAGERVVLAVIDARRGEVFAAAYAVTGGLPADELLPPSVLAPANISGVVTQARERHGDRGQPWLALGDGAVRYRSQLELAGVTVPADSSPLHRIDAEAICELGAQAPTPAWEQIVPDYRRPSDAEITLERAGLQSRESHCALKGAER